MEWEKSWTINFNARCNSFNCCICFNPIRVGPSFWWWRLGEEGYFSTDHYQIIWRRKNCDTVAVTSEEYLHCKGCVDCFILRRTHIHNSVTTFNWYFCYEPRGLGGRFGKCKKVSAFNFDPKWANKLSP